MTKFVSIFFLIVFAMITFQDLVYFGLFKLNQEFIADKYCVNKEKKEMSCKGKCHYSKQVKKAQQEQEKPFNVKERLEVNLIFSEFHFELKKEVFHLVHQTQYFKKYFDSYQNNLLCPPQAA